MNVSRREDMDATGMNCTFLSGHAAAVRFGCVNIVTG